MNEILRFAFLKTHDQVPDIRFVTQFISIFDHWLTRDEFEDYFPAQASKSDLANNERIADCMTQLSRQYRVLTIDAWPDGRIDSSLIDRESKIDEVRNKICSDSFFDWFGLYFEELEIVIIKGYEYTCMCVSRNGIPYQLKEQIEKRGLFILEKSA